MNAYELLEQMCANGECPGAEILRLRNLVMGAESRVALLEKAHQSAVAYLADKGPCFKKMREDDPDCGFENCLNCALEKAVKEASTETTP